MDELVHIIYDFIGGFFEINSSEEKISKKIKRALIGVIIFLVCFITLISYIVTSNANFTISR